MKDCRYVDGDFIIKYCISDGKLFVYYKDGRVDSFIYDVTLEKKVIIKMKKQLVENVMFKKMRKRDKYLSLINFYILVLFSFVQYSSFIDEINLENGFCFFGVCGITLYDLYYYIKNDSMLSEIIKDEYFLNNIDGVVSFDVNNLDNYSIKDLKCLKQGKQMFLVLFIFRVYNVVEGIV